MPRGTAAKKAVRRPKVRYDLFPRYDELTRVLKAWAAWRPRLMQLSSLGKSYEGRDIWLCAVTNRDTGPHSEKPALWVDANIHATEVTGGNAALHLIERLLTGHRNDDRVTRALDTRCFYVVPRLNPDGVELALADRPRFLRSSVRPWPRTDPQDGLVPEDVDGDGRILLMRIPDPNGMWTADEEDPRLLVARPPDSARGDGDNYRLLVEGKIRNYDGATIKAAPPLEGLDLNRNFPAGWRTENEQHGAGPYPASEPEIRAEVQGLVDRPNVCGFISYHTFSGVHLRPYSTEPDDKLPTFDLRVFKQIGAKATEFTGYPSVSVFHDFKYDPKDVVTGAADDWAYEHLGIHAWTTEFWAPMREAGIEDYKFIEWFGDHPVEDERKLLAWSDTELKGQGYVEWYPFEHPQLGPVELGGWHMMHSFTNPPAHRVEGEIAPHSEFALWHVLISPLLELRSVEATAAGAGEGREAPRGADGVWRVRLVVENTGWLPTNVTEKAVERRAVLDVEAEIKLPRGAALASGEAKQNLGQLAGRALHNSMIWTSDGTPDRAKADWVVRAKEGAKVKVEVRHQRAGVVRAEVVLGG